MRSPLRWLLASVRHWLAGGGDPRRAWDTYRRWLSAHGLDAWFPEPEEQAALDRAGFRPKGASPAECRSILRIVHLPEVAAPGSAGHRPGAGGSPGGPPIPPPATAPQPLGDPGTVLGELAAWLRQADSEQLGVDAFLEHAAGSLARLAWPDGTGVIPFVLGMRLETALALAVHQADDPTQPCLLVGGDISGIQRFIYTISSTGALKSLRARSLYLEMLSRSLAADIASLATRDLFGPGAEGLAEVYVGGGRFYCVLPNRQDIHRALDELIRRRTGALLDEFDGDLRVGVARTPFTPAGAWSDARSLWAQVQHGLSEAKNRPFHDRLGDPAFWQPGSTTTECQVCRRPSADLGPLTPEFDPGEEPPQACPACRAFYEVGGRLSQLLGFAEVAANDPTRRPTTWRLAGTTLQALHGKGGPEAGVVRRWILPGHPLGPTDRRLPAARRVALGPDGDVLTIEELAARSTGANWLGVVRMDVDRLGRLFCTGLPDGFRSVGHVAALSRALEEFFSRRLADILGRDGEGRPRSITMIYGGGDDAFWIGPWDQVVEALFDVHRAFQAETGGNPSVSVSAGFIVARPHTPIYRLAEVAGEAEDAAKEAGRNRVALFWAPGLVTPTRDDRPDGDAGSPGRHRPESPYVMEWQWAWQLRSDFFETIRREFMTPPGDGPEPAGEDAGRSKGGPRAPSPSPAPWQFRADRGLSRALINRLIQLLQAAHYQDRQPLVALVWALSRWRERLSRRADSAEDDPALKAWKAVNGSFVQPESRRQLLPFLTWIALLTREEEKR